MNLYNKYIAMLMVCVFAFVSQLHGQCTSPPSCLSNGTQHVDPTNNNWQASHSGVSFPNHTTNFAPTSGPGSSCLHLTSILSLGGGAFTCYNFKANTDYRVCFWAREYATHSTQAAFGQLYVYAANGLTPNMYANTPTNPNTVVGSKKQLKKIHFYGGHLGNSSAYESKWIFYSVTFNTGSNPYSSLWFYAHNPAGAAPPGTYPMYADYHVEVDDIRVEEMPSTPYNIYTQDNTNNTPIDGCTGSAEIEVLGLPANTIINWPAGANPTGPFTAEVTPCSTTTYTIELIGDPNPTVSPACANCVKQKLTHTIEVDQWGDPARIIHPTGVIPCTTPFTLEYDDPLTCQNVSYVWIDPDQNATTANPVTFTAGAQHTGEWTLQIINPNKPGCAEEYKFMVAVGSCCISNPSFTTDPTSCNPIHFTNTSTGVTNQVSAIWDFGDGTQSGQMNPIHTYNVTQQTTFDVRLTMLYEDGQGEICCQRTTQPVTVCPPNDGDCGVTADFGVSLSTHVLDPPRTYDFVDQSSGNGSICDWEWKVNNVLVASGTPNLKYTFPYGFHDVCLTVYNCIYAPDGTLSTICSDTKCIVMDIPAVLGDDGEHKGGKKGAGGNMASGGAIGSQNRSQNVIAQSEIIVHPNPNMGDFTISIPKRTGVYQVVVWDNLRRKVYEQQHSFNGSSVKVKLSDLPSGVYSLEVLNENEKFVEKISIVK